MEMSIVKVHHGGFLVVILFIDFAIQERAKVSARNLVHLGTALVSGGQNVNACFSMRLFLCLRGSGLWSCFEATQHSCRQFDGHAVWLNF